MNPRDRLAYVAAFVMACLGGVLSVQPDMGGPFTMLVCALAGPALVTGVTRRRPLLVALLHNVLLSVTTLVAGATLRGTCRPFDELVVVLLLFLAVTAIPAFIIGGVVSALRPRLPVADQA